MRSYRFVVGLDLSLTGTGIVVIDRRSYRPTRFGGVKWVRFGRDSVSKTDLEKRIDRIVELEYQIYRFVMDAVVDERQAIFFFEQYGFSAQHRGMDIAELGGVVKRRFRKQPWGQVLHPVTSGQARKLFLGIGKGEGIKFEVVRQLEKLNAPFARGFSEARNNDQRLAFTDASDAFLVANFGLSELGDKRAISVARSPFY